VPQPDGGGEEVQDGGGEEVQDGGGVEPQPDGGGEEVPDGGSEEVPDAGLPGDSCAWPLPLFPDDAGTVGSIAGDLTLVGFGDDGWSSCGGAGGADRVWTFTTSEPGAFRFAVAATSLVSPNLRLKRGSCRGETYACARADPSDAFSAELYIPSLPADRWFLWLDGNTAEGGTFNFLGTLEEGLKAGDLCSNAEDLGESPQFSGAQSTYGFANDVADAGTCRTAPGPDRFYRFTTSETLDLHVTVDPDLDSYQPVLYLLQSCSGPMLGCSRAGRLGGVATLNLPELPAGTYWLGVDGTGPSGSGSFGRYTLDIDVE
jgi:hypothetical protein